MSHHPRVQRDMGPYMRHRKTGKHVRLDYTRRKAKSKVHATSAGRQANAPRERYGKLRKREEKGRIVKNAKYSHKQRGAGYIVFEERDWEATCRRAASLAETKIGAHQEVPRRREATARVMSSKLEGQRHMK